MWPDAARTEVAAALAATFLAGEWEEAGLLARAAETLDRRPRWLGRLVSVALSTYRERPADRPRELERLLAHHLGQLYGRQVARPPRVRRWPAFEPAMGRTRWPVPAIATIPELAAFLDLHLGELEWLADRRGLERSVDVEKLRHYRYTWLPRRGGVPRAIERPKRLLKDVHRRILHQILDRVPPHDEAHGFRLGHSALTHARRHVDRRVVLRVDLEDFFASIDASRIYGLFRATGYPEAVAHALTALCTNVVPRAEWARVPRPEEPWLIAAHHRLGKRLATPHLPQGAPTSPALANLCAFGLDRRVAGLAARLGATYSRYADDIAVSGDTYFLARAASVRQKVAEIAAGEGFRVNERKAALMTRAGRQRVTGIVVNARPNVPRREYDRLKAILHDAAQNGPAAADRAGVPDFRAHLLGRIAWVEQLNPERGAKLRRRFDEIEWG